MLFVDLISRSCNFEKWLLRLWRTHRSPVLFARQAQIISECYKSFLSPLDLPHFWQLGQKRGWQDLWSPKIDRLEGNLCSTHAQSQKSFWSALGFPESGHRIREPPVTFYRSSSAFKISILPILHRKMVTLISLLTCSYLCQCGLTVQVFRRVDVLSPLAHSKARIILGTHASA